MVVYLPAINGGILWDDDMHVTQPHLQSAGGLYRIWFEIGATLQYYPLLHTVFWIEHKLWGDATLGYHLTNVLLHTVDALLVAWILRRLKIPGAYLAAAVFALHPIQAESVAWITEQKNTLSGLFYLGSLLAYLDFDQSRKRSSYGWAIGLFLLGVLTKTVIATLPGALLVIFWWRRGRLSWRRDVLPLAPFFVLGAGGGLITAWWELQINKCFGPDFTFTPVERCLIAGRTAWFLLGKLLWPTRLTFIYPRWEINAAAWWQYAFPLGAAALLAALWLIRRRSRAPLAAALFYGGTLFPMLGFFNLYTFVFSFVANHYQYLAGLGPIVLASAGAALLLTRWRLWNRPGGYVLCLVPLAILAGLTRQQSEMYRDAETLYRQTLAENPDCWMACNNLGKILFDLRRIDEAMVYHRKALQIKPDDALAHHNLGMCFACKGDYDEAIACYRRALELAPNYANAHNDLGGLLLRQGEFDEAAVHFSKAMELAPKDPSVRRNREFAVAHRDAARKLLAQQREAIRARPNDVGLLNSVAWTRAASPIAMMRDGAESVELAERAARLSEHREPAVLGTLAAAYAEAGRFPEAVQTARQALQLATRQDKQSLADSIAARLLRYEAGKPFRDTRSP